MSSQPKTPGEYPGPTFPTPEVVPQLVPVVEIKKETPIEIINGALEEIRRSEREEEGGEIKRGPTFH